MDRSSPTDCSVTHCVAVVLLSPEDPTLIMLRQEMVRADDMENAVEAAKASALDANLGWIVQCASALRLSPNTDSATTH